MAAKKTKKPAEKKPAQPIDKKLAKVTGEVLSPLTKLKKADWPEYGFGGAGDSGKPCAWDYDREPPKVFVNFRVLSPARAEKLKVKPGPAMRLCFKADEPGVVVNVSTPEEAMKIGTRFRECAADSDDVKKCALDAVDGKPSVFGKAPRRRSKK